jgi:hypothetical protein
MCTATIVVSLPTLKAFLVRATPTSTSKRSTTGYKNESYGKPASNHKMSGLHVHIQGGRINDDEVELVSQLSRQPSISASQTTSATGVPDP